MDGIWIGNGIEWTLTLIATDIYDRATELDTASITATTVHINSSQSSLAIVW